MGLFGRNKKEEAEKEVAMHLPALPKLPEFPVMGEEMMQIHKLPSFPSNNLGTKFSQNTIKDAVTGEEGGDFPDDDADDFADEEKGRMMQEPLKKPLTEEMGEKRFPSRFSSEERRFPSRTSSEVSQEPVFIRIDKFEGAMKIFNETKKKISEIESALEGIKELKDKEEREIQLWENELRLMKDKIEKVDRDIFSKV